MATVVVTVEDTVRDRQEKIQLDTLSSCKDALLTIIHNLSLPRRGGLLRRKIPYRLFNAATNKRLRGNKPLSDYGITEGSVLRLRSNRRGQVITDALDELLEEILEQVAEEIWDRALKRRVKRTLKRIRHTDTTGPTVDKFMAAIDSPHAAAALVTVGTSVGISPVVVIGTAAAVLVVGGVVAAVVMGWLSAKRRQVGGWGPGIGLGLLAALLVLGVIAYGQAYTPIERGTVGLVMRFGGLTGDVMEPGLNWRTPFIDKVVIVPTVKQSYETSDNPGSSSADYTDVAVAAQTVDGQQIKVKYTVLFAIPPESAVDIVQSIGTVDRVVENVVKASSRSWARVLAQNYSAEDLYSGEGILAYEQAVGDALAEVFEQNGFGLDDFLIRKIDFDLEYINAIEQQQIAQEAIETARYEAEAAEYEKERQIRLAEAEAERTKLLAAADAERQRLLADSEAYSIEARGAALERYPALVQWEFVTNLEGVSWGILPGEGITPLVPLPEFE